MQNEIEQPELFTKQSIQLLSDGTFQIFIQKYEAQKDRTYSKWGDGLWTLSESTNLQMGIKLWGRWHLVLPHHMETDQSVFQEELLIKPGLLEGVRMLGTFYLE